MNGSPKMGFASHNEEVRRNHNEEVRRNVSKNKGPQRGPL